VDGAADRGHVPHLGVVERDEAGLGAWREAERDVADDEERAGEERTDAGPGAEGAATDAGLGRSIEAKSVERGREAVRPQATDDADAQDVEREEPDLAHDIGRVEQRVGVCGERVGRGEPGAGQGDGGGDERERRVRQDRVEPPTGTAVAQRLE
jgi:hypothetical protein